MDVQRLGEIPPVRSTLHQFGEHLVCFPVIIEALRPEVPRIAHHYFATIEQERVIVSWESSKTRLQWHPAHSEANGVHFTALRKTETALSRSETAK